jgi:hypothetical protein
MARKVAIRRVNGQEHPNITLGAEREGWEMIRPTAGERYFLFTDAGAIFRSSRVLRVGPSSFETQNSVYSIRIIQDEAETFVTQELGGFV